MADVKISALPLATTPLAGTEVLPIVQSATTDQVSVANLTAGRAVSAASLTLTTPLSAANGGTGITSLGTGVATTLGNAINGASGFCVQDASGNVGIGTGINTIGSKLEIQGASASNCLRIRTTSASVEPTAYYDIGRDSDGYLKFNGAQTTFVGYKFFLTGTQAMTLDASGNLLLGTTSASGKLTVSGGDLWVSGSQSQGQVSTNTSAGGELDIYSWRNTASWDGAFFIGYRAHGSASAPTAVASGDDLLILTGRGYSGTSYNDTAQIRFSADGTPSSTSSPGRLSFYTTASGATSSTERMRIDSSGNLLVGKTTTVETTVGWNLSGNGAGNCKIASGQYFVWNRDEDNIIVNFRRSNTSVGTISVTTTATAYNTSSDISMKENIAPADSSLASILAFPVDQFDWKADGSHTDYGCVAQKAIDYAPEIVTQGDIWSVDYGRITPRLIKAFQELAAKVSALEARI